MKWLRLRQQLKEAKDDNRRLLGHVAKQEARIANLQADIAGYERLVKALSETCPSTIEELQADG